MAAEPLVAQIVRKKRLPPADPADVLLIVHQQNAGS